MMAFQDWEGETLDIYDETRSANCNICSNFSNIFKRSHRLSSSHQTKLTERFRKIRSKMISFDSVVVHDHQWGRDEDVWCYFCDKSVKKHQVYEGCTVEYLGYLTHLNNPQHFKAVKRYLRYNYRKENAGLFCKKKPFLDRFLARIPAAIKKYLAELDFIHQKDVAHMKEIEAQQQLLVDEAFQVPIFDKGNEAAVSDKEKSIQQTSTLQNISSERNVNLNPKRKICPWLVESKNCCDLEKPVIGPTIDTLNKHVADQKKKLLPVKRLGTNFQRKQIYSSHWLPSFSGVWNKRRMRQIK